MTTMTTMMRPGLDLLATIASTEGLRFGIVLALKTSVLLAVAAVATLVLARRTAALRHFIWSLALGGALALPFVAGTLPWSWRVLPARLAEAAATPASASGAIAPARVTGHDAMPALTKAPQAARADANGAAPARTADIAEPVAASSSLAPRTVPVGWIALALWAAVADVLLLHLVAGRLSLMLMARRATPVLDETFLEELVRGTRAAGVRRPVRLLWSHRARVPMTWGIRRPVVLLPEDARSWNRERIALVLHHELAHVRRVDDLTHVLARVACAMHWFNPLVWWAASRLRDESELACDDQVLRTGARASEYARHLLELVSKLGVRSVPVGALPLAQRSRFEGRLLAILDPARRRSGLERGGAAALFMVAAGLVVLLGAVAPARADAAPKDEPHTSPVTNAVTQDTRVASAPVVAQDAAAKTADAEATPREAATNADDEDAALALADSASVRALMRALTQDDDEGVRRAAAWALGQLEDRAATTALSTALTADISIEVRRTAAWALGQIEDPAAVSALGQALSDADAEVRHTALWALGQIESPEAIPELTRALDDPEADVRKTAAWALGQIESPEAVGPLSSLVGDPDEEVREQAVWALGQIESREAVAPVSRALSDESPRVRKQAAWALGQIEAVEALPALSSALSDTNTEVAATAAWAIGQIEPSAAPAALLEAVRSGSGELRSNALWALVQIEDPAAVPVLTEVLRDQNPDVRGMALRGLAEIRDESAIRAITGLLEDPDPEVRAAAVRALAGRGGGWGASPRPRPQPRPRPRPLPNGG
jgi:HEAT repeat protein/beta-lactamase regulating signal transducer with metallopeptidase domain